MTDHSGGRLVRASGCDGPACVPHLMELLLFSDLDYTTHLKTHG